MRALAAVFRREVRDRRLLLQMALLLGVVPLLLPFVPGVSGSDSSSLRMGTATILALITAFALSLLLGASGIAGDLFAGRMGFYFSRPLPAWTIWGGKLAANLALVTASALLVLLPALLLEALFGSGAGPSGWGDSLPWGLGFFAWSVGAVFLGLGAHFLSVSVRSRSPWLVLDLAGITVVAVAVTALWRFCAAERADPELFSRTIYDDDPFVGWWLLGGFAAFLFLALLLASAVQVAHGRIDPRRSHRLQSLFLWSAVALGLAGLGWATRAAFRVAPEDLADIALVHPASRGPWLAVQGTARRRPGFRPALLVDAASGRFVQLRRSPTADGFHPAAFTPDGRTAWWCEAQGSPKGPRELTTLDLAAPEARPRATGAACPERLKELSAVLLSPDGRRAASWDGRRLTVEDLATHALLLARDLRQDGAGPLPAILSFAAPGRLWLDLLDVEWRWVHDRGLEGSADAAAPDREPSRVLTFEADLATGRVEPGAKIESPLQAHGWRRSPEGERGLLVGSERVEVYDTRSGRRLGSHPGPVDWIRFVPGGLLLERSAEDAREVVLLDRDGSAVRARLPLPEGAPLAVGEVGEGGRSLPLYLQDRPWQERPGTFHAWHGWRLDLERGVFERRLRARLYLLSAGSAWSAEAMRRADGLAIFDTAREEIRAWFPPRSGGAEPR